MTIHLLYTVENNEKKESPKQDELQYSKLTKILFLRSNVFCMKGCEANNWCISITCKSNGITCTLFLSTPQLWSRQLRCWNTNCYLMFESRNFIGIQLIVFIHCVTVIGPLVPTVSRSVYCWGSSVGSTYRSHTGIRWSLYNLTKH